MKKAVYEFGKQCRILKAYDITYDTIVIRVDIRIGDEHYATSCVEAYKPRLSRKSKVRKLIERLYLYVTRKDPCGTKKGMYKPLPQPADKFHIIQEGCK